jgi:hypothetical protein
VLKFQHNQTILKEFGKIFIQYIDNLVESHRKLKPCYDNLYQENSYFSMLPLNREGTEMEIPNIFLSQISVKILRKKTGFCLTTSLRRLSNIVGVITAEYLHVSCIK